MLFILISLGATGAGLFLLFRSFVPWLTARRTGVIRTQGARPQIVSREAEPERFEALSKNRLNASMPGLMLFAIGGLLSLVQIVALVLMVSAEGG